MGKRNRGSGRRKQTSMSRSTPFRANDSWLSVCGPSQERILDVKSVERDTDRSFRPLFVNVRASMATASGLCQVDIFANDARKIASSGPTIISNIPQNITVRWPVQTNSVWPAGSAGPLVSITHICVGKGEPFVHAQLLALGTIHFMSGAEIFAAKCPQVNLKTPLAEQLYISTASCSNDLLEPPVITRGIDRSDSHAMVQVSSGENFPHLHPPSSPLRGVRDLLHHPVLATGLNTGMGEYKKTCPCCLSEITPTQLRRTVSLGSISSSFSSLDLLGHPPLEQPKPSTH